MKKFLSLLTICLISGSVASAEDVDEKIFEDANEIQLEYLEGKMFSQITA